MTIVEINAAIESAAKKMLSDSGNSKERDDLLRALANLTLLQVHVENQSINSVLSIIQKLASIEVEAQ